MSRVNAQCNLCGQPAKTNDVGSGGDLLVDCSNCGIFTISHRARLFYFNQNKLDADALKKLSNYVQNQKGNTPLLITAKVINSVTGKNSVGLKP